MTKPVFIPLAAGLQTELADQLVQPGATLVLENASHQQTGEGQARLGSDVLATSAQATIPSGGTLPTPWQLATLGGSLVRFNRAPTPIHTWAATPAAFVRPTFDTAGVSSYRKGPIKLDTSPVFSGTQAGDQIYTPTVAVSGDVIVEVYELFASRTAVVIMDRATRRPVFTRLTAAGTRCPRVVIVGARAVVAFENENNKIQVDSYNLTTYALSQQQVMGDCFPGTPIDMRVGGPVAGANNVHIIYKIVTTGELRCAVVDATNLATNSTFTPRTTAGVAVVPNLAFGWLQDLASSGQYAIMIADTTNGLRALWNLPAPTAGNSDAVATHILDAGATAAPSGATAGIRNLIGSTYAVDTTGAYKVLYEVTAPSNPTWATIKVAKWFGGDGFAVTGTVYRSVGIRSKLWAHAGSYYFLSAFDGTDQRSYFVLALAVDGEPTSTTYPAPLAVAFVRDAGGLTEQVSAPSDVSVGPDNEIFVGVTSETRVESLAPGGTAIGGTARLFAAELVRIRHAEDIETEVGPPVEFLRSLFVPGALIGHFDGQTYATAGFAYYPPAFTLIAQAGGDLTPDGVYFWRALYSFVDRNGRKWRSAPTAPITATASGGIEQYDVVIDTLRLFDRGWVNGNYGFQIEVYRTQANEADAYFLVATVPNNPTGNTVTFRDNVADTALGEQLYTDGGGLENQLLPPVAWCVEQDGRLVCGEAGAGTVWESVEADFQSGLIFNEALTFDVGDPRDPTTGGAVFGQTLFVFKEGKVYVVDGKGANALGQGSTRTPRLIGVGVGCSNPQSIVVADDGVWFRSSGARAGIYRTAGGVPEYVGAGVRAYDGNTITSAVVVRDQTEIRFYTQNGTTLVWNWTTRSWSTNTQQSCLSATTGYEPVTGVVYAHAGTESILAEATTSSADPYREAATPIFLRASTPWYQAAGIGGWERIKRIQGIGSMASDGAHTAVIRCYKNFEASPFQSAEMVFDGTEEAWNWELRPAQQKVTAFRIEVEIQSYQPASRSVDPTGWTRSAGQFFAGAAGTFTAADEGGTLVIVGGALAGTYSITNVVDDITIDTDPVPGGSGLVAATSITITPAPQYTAGPKIVGVALIPIAKEGADKLPSSRRAT